jgi:predicted component of type VI protein secretion system
MAYLIFTANGEEYDRRELKRSPVVIGRAPDCNISVHDILLSRHHCKLELQGDGETAVWVLTDLQSKNGTHFRGRQVNRHELSDGDELRIGRSRLTFKAGVYVPSESARRRAVVRAVDPHEALSGTVSGMVVCEPGETQKHQGMPFPQPRPSDPTSFAKDDVYGMISDIISSSWDSIQAEASQPRRMQRVAPTPAATKAAPMKPKPRVSFCLQAEDDGKKSSNRPAVPMPAAVQLDAPRRSRRRQVMIAACAVVAVSLAIWVIAGLSRASRLPADAVDPSSTATPPPTSSSHIERHQQEPVTASARIVEIDDSMMHLVGY